MLRLRPKIKNPFRDRDGAQSQSMTIRFDKFKSSVKNFFHNQKKMVSRLAINLLIDLYLT